MIIIPQIHIEYQMNDINGKSFSTCGVAEILIERNINRKMNGDIVIRLYADD